MDVIDHILVLILERIHSPVYLVRAASTCKRWHDIIADASFLRRYRSAHAPSLVAGDYFNGILSKEEPLSFVGPRLIMDRRPSFVPADAASSPIAARNFSSLDFLPGDGDGDDNGDDCPPTWAILDSRGSLLLLYRTASYDDAYPDCFVCEPATRGYKRIPPPPNLKPSYSYMGIYLVDGEADTAGARIGISNFRVLYMFEHNIETGLDTYIGTAMFTAGSSGSSSWGSWTPRLAVGSPDDAINDQDLVNMRDLGRAGGSQYFYAQGRNLLVALDRSSGEFSHAVFPPPSESQGDGDLDLRMRRSLLYATDGRDGEPRVLTVFDETMRVYAKKLDGGEWALEKSLSLREATRGLPGYTDELFGLPGLLGIVTRGPGYVILILSPRIPGTWGMLQRRLISVDLETMQVALAPAAETGAVMFRCEIPWPPVLIEQCVDR